MPTSTRIALGLSVPALIAGAVLAGSAQAVPVQLEPSPCLITLPANFVANTDGYVKTLVPDSAIACPGFAYDSYTDAVGIPFQTDSGQANLELRTLTENVLDPVANTISQVNGLYLVGNQFAPATFTSVAPGNYNANSFYLVHGGLNYRFQLVSPFSVVSQAPAAPTCTLNLAPTYAYKWDQEGYFIVPDSAVQCTGFTYNSTDYYAALTFDSKVTGAGSVLTSSRRVYNAATRTYANVNELHLSSMGLFRFAERGHRETGMPGPAGTTGWTWGRFSQGAQIGTVTPNNNLSSDRVTAALNLKQSFAIKRLTTVTASGTHVAGGGLKVKIHADRNWGFQNTTAPTYRRQTVLPDTPADHAQVLRDGKVIRKVKLSPYGNASVTIPAAGRHRYTVQMVETNDNFAGSARFTK